MIKTFWFNQFQSTFKISFHHFVRRYLYQQIFDDNAQVLYDCWKCKVDSQSVKFSINIAAFTQCLGNIFNPLLLNSIGSKDLLQTCWTLYPKYHASTFFGTENITNSISKESKQNCVPLKKISSLF